MDSRTAFCGALLLLVTLLPLSASASSKLYIVYMGEKKHDDPSVVTASHHDMLTSVFGSKDEALRSIVYSYKHGFSGFAAMLTESQAEAIAKFPEVATVEPNTFHETHTTRSWDFLGLDHNQPAQQPGLLKKAKYGEDVIVGVIDTGIWPESRSFDDKGYGPVPARWKGKCETGEEFNATSCNKKIIGARWYGRGISAELLKGDYKSARDNNGHGTHVASTIAGGEVQGVSYGGLGMGMARGGAPRARLSIYKACWVGGSCSGAAVLAAVDDAIHDGVDVLSLSIGGAGPQFPGTLHAVQRGISVVFSGGNDGPVPQTVGNALPWVTTVAASTIDRSFPTLISLGNKEKLGQSLNYNAAMNNSGFQDLVHVQSCDTESLSLSNVTGKTVLCYAPAQAAITPPRAELHSLINRTIEAGAKGLIFAQYTVNLLEILTSCEGFMSCALVDFEIAQRIASYSKMTESPVVKISPAVSVVGNGVLSPYVASFSSRGPSLAFPRILKPDIAAPGVGILAAERDSYVFHSGTSMACPHVSAVTALLKSVHPDWSPAMIKSAIVTTASVTDRFGMPIQANGVPRKLADPFDFGGGHMDPDRAVDPGLVYDQDAREYNKFLNCTLGLQDGCKSYNLNLNLPSITVPDLKDHVILRRTVTNVGPAEATYHLVVEAPAGIDVMVEPSVISFTQGSSRSATFTAMFTTRQRVQGGYTFGSLTWSDGSTHSVRIPVAIRTVIQDFIADTA
uniref:Subtilisin-like protease n=1 Tax=Aegilops tauschii subsp. strangulata TaxID=200361 RepID=A0A453QRN5_AEGTS